MSISTNTPDRAASRRRRPVLRFTAAVLLTVAGALVALPDLLFGLDRYSPFAQVVAFRPVVLVGVGVLLLVLALLLLRTRSVWPFVAGLLAVVVVGAAMLAPRLWTDPVGVGGPGIGAAGVGGTSLTVLAVNVHEGDGDVGQVAALIGAERPDLVSIPEAGAEYRSRLAPLVEPLGYRLYGSTGEGPPDVEGVTALAHSRLGDLRASIDDATLFPSVVLDGGELGELRFVAFHSLAPVPRGVAQWRSELAHVSTWCAGRTPAIVAGDFNATLDHSAFRDGTAGCGDAAEQRGEGLVATWPARSPRWLGTQIDHVVATEGIAARTFEIHDIDGSDHRAVLTRLQLPRG